MFGKNAKDILCKGLCPMICRSELIFFLNLCFLSLPINAQLTKGYGQELDKAFLQLNEVLTAQRKEGSSYAIAVARFRLGTLCQENGVYTEAIAQFNTAIALLENEVHDSLYLDLINGLGVVHMNLKNYDNAEDYFKRAVIEAGNLGDERVLAGSKSNLGACYEKKRNYSKALKYENESLELYHNLNDEEGISIVNENIGSIYEDLGEFALAKQYFEKSLDHHKGTTDSRLANILNNIGDVYRKTDLLEKALEYTEEALKISQYCGDREEEASAYKDLSKNYSLMGNHEMAYNSLAAFLNIDEENTVLYNANQATALQVIYDSKEKEAQIQSLLHHRKIDNAQKGMLLMSIIIVMVFATIWYFYIRRRRREAQKVFQYEQYIHKVELERKQAEEENLQKEVHLKNSALSRYSLHLSHKNKMLSGLSQTIKNSLDRTNVDLKRKLQEIVKEIDLNLAQEHEWDEFMAFFKEIHPDFIRKITDMALEPLSPAELRLGILVRLNIPSKEIASILKVTPDSIRVARYRLRKKLPIDSKEELYTFLMTL